MVRYADLFAVTGSVSKRGKSRVRNVFADNLVRQC